MKLKAYHIENFGNISNDERTFDDNLTEICENNGFGKTTLAAFIKAMFYGLPPYKETGKGNDLPERKRFYPFNNGKFGGSLTFEMGGSEYKIERFLGKKSVKDDTLIIYCNGKKFNGFDGDIGRAVFELDKNSFERTVFINSDAIEICATEGISAKLNNFVVDLDGDNSIADVIGAIEKSKKMLKADRGSKGLIEDVKQEIFDVTNDIKNLESMSTALDEKYAETDRLKREIAEQEAAIKEIADRNLLIERWQRYDEIATKKADVKSGLDELGRQYPHGVPNENEIVEMKKHSERLAELRGKITATVFDEDKRQRLNELSELFSEGVPSEEFLHELKHDIEEITSGEAKLSALKNQGRSDRVCELEQKFGKGVPDDDEIGSLEEKVERYRQLENRQKAQTSVAVGSASVVRKPKTYLALVALVAVIVACGIGLFFVNKILGGILLGIGVVVGLAVGFLCLKNLSANRTVVVDEKTVKLQTEMQQIEVTVREGLVRYGYYSKNGVVFDFEMFKKDLTDYLDSVDKAAEAQQEFCAQRKEIDDKIEKVNVVFAKYGVKDDSLLKSYMALQNLVDAFIALHRDSESADKKKRDVANAINECTMTIEHIATKYGIAFSDNIAERLDDLTAAVNRFSRLNDESKKFDAEMVEYRKKYDLTKKPTEEIVDTAKLKKSLQENRIKLADIDYAISADEAEVETLDEKRNQLESVKERLDEYNKKFNIYKATIEFLETAENNLKDRYISPIRDNFLYYANMLEETLGEKITVDQDFNIMFERGGENRSDKHLSAGQRSLCALCFRLALVNKMYETEKPFILMDDPFVHLDERHLERTRKLVRSLSETNQIIYFSCHKSRKISV